MTATMSGIPPATTTSHLHITNAAIESLMAIDNPTLQIPSALRLSHPNLASLSTLRNELPAALSQSSTSNYLLPQPANPLTHSSSEMSLQQAALVEYEQRLLALQKLYQQEEANLWNNFQQTRIQLSMQHVRNSYQLYNDYVQRIQAHELLLAQQTVAVSQANSIDTNNAASSPGLSSPHQLRRSYSQGASGAISVETRQRLRTKIYQNMQQKFQPQESPTESMASNTCHGSTSSIHTIQKLQDRKLAPHGGPDFELRKASSEPNLKMKTNLALRHKLMKNRTSPLTSVVNQASTSGRPSPPKRPYPETMDDQMIGGSYDRPKKPVPILYSSPSLPNIRAPGATELMQLGFVPPAGINAFSDLSLFGSAPNFWPYATGGLTVPAGVPITMDSLGLQAAPPSGFLFEGGEKSGEPSKAPRQHVVVDRRTLSSPLPLAQAQLQAAAAAATSSPQAVANSNYLKQQIRNLCMRRKSLVREETEEEVQMEFDQPALAKQLAYNLKSFSSPLPVPGSMLEPLAGSPTYKFVTGLAYDTLMSKHACTCKESNVHYEHSGRIQSIWARLQETGLVAQCEKVICRKAPLDYLRLVHTESYVTFFGNSGASRTKLDVHDLPIKNFHRLQCGGIAVDNDTYFNESFTAQSARMAVGCVCELAQNVYEGKLKNGFAVVRPPGHHAELNCALGFCYFNNVAIAARVLQIKCGVKRIAIIDWDIHHGNGTQMTFDSDPGVLFISLHRYEDSRFFPGSGGVHETGKGPGEGFKVNIPWSGEVMTDVEYLAAYRTIVDPILSQYQPEIILVSAGFDGTKGHAANIGGYSLTPTLFAYYTREMKRFAQGKLVLSLEGGYDLTSICDCAEACVRVLCGESPQDFPDEVMKAKPCAAACKTLKEVVKTQQKYWKLTYSPVEVSQAEYECLMQKFASLSVKQRTLSDSTDSMD